MSHIYQPVMRKELLKRGGKASIRDIVAAFLARDASQLEYYGNQSHKVDVIDGLPLTSVRFLKATLRGWRPHAGAKETTPNQNVDGAVGALILEGLWNFGERIGPAHVIMTAICEY